MPVGAGEWESAYIGWAFPHIIVISVYVEGFLHMAKLIGYTLFWIAVGMLLMLLIDNAWVGLILIAIFIIVGYNLFQCSC